MKIDIEQLEQAVRAAMKGRSTRKDVARLTSSMSSFVNLLKEDIENGKYIGKLRYRKLSVTNRNGKSRTPMQPDFYTLCVEHFAISLLMPYYRNQHIGMNCIEGRGITSKKKRYSLLRRVKHVYYDRLDLQAVVSIDQRKCYDHITGKTLRRSLKGLGVPKEIADFAISLSFIDGKFPIGTPLSPLCHHIVMAEFDKWVSGQCYALRYADNVFCFLPTIEEAQRMRWRIKNFWWYRFGIRAKRNEVIVQSTSQPMDVCGYVVHSNRRGITDHDKGYVSVRESTCKRARKATGRNWSSYFGLLKHADCFGLMTKIEKKMNLSELTQKVRIDRTMDAEPITPKELADKGIVFTVYDYELRKDKEKTNWIKCLIGYHEEIDGIDRVVAREFHGNYSYLIAYHEQLERYFGGRSFLPIENAEIVNRCGFIYKGSSNIIQFIEK